MGDLLYSRTFVSDTLPTNIPNYHVISSIRAVHCWVRLLQTDVAGLSRPSEDGPSSLLVALEDMLNLVPRAGLEPARPFGPEDFLTTMTFATCLLL